MWDSPRKEKPGVMISEITGITLGQTTPVFKKNPNPVFEVCCVCQCMSVCLGCSLPSVSFLPQSLSFSLLYSGRSLDLICKDKREYKVWTTALKVSLAVLNSTPLTQCVSGVELHTLAHQTSSSLPLLYAKLCMFYSNNNCTHDII